MGVFSLSIILVFFLTALALYYYFKRKNPDANPLRNLLFWTSVMVLSPIIYISTIWIWFSVGASYHDKPFSQSEWMNQPHSRYRFTKDIVESNVLKNLAREEVVELLGAPSKENDSMLIYNTGYNPKIFMNGRPDFLEVSFKMDRVNKSKINR